MTTVFRGSTSECLEHLRGSGDDRRQALVDFLGPPPRLGGVLRRLGDEPSGERLLRLHYFLEANGYEVTELERLGAVVRRFGRLIAFQILDIAVATRLIHLKYDRDLFRFLFGKRPTPLVRQTLMDEVYRAKEALLKARFQELTRQGIIPERAFTDPMLAVASLQGDGSLDHKLVLDVLAHHIQAMLPLAERVVGQRFSQEERRYLREAAGGDHLFRLSTTLNQLCSERARRELLRVRQPRRKDR